MTTRRVFRGIFPGISRRLLLSVAAAFLAAGAVAAGALAVAQPQPPPAAPEAGPVKANPCVGADGKPTKGCKVIAGPWVAVPATGEATFLLECTKRRGYVVGVDVLATSADVRVAWEANPGAPVRPATSTGYFGFFRASSANAKAGLFQPYIGCIPAPKPQKRSTVSWRITKESRVLTSARAVRPGAFLDRRQTLLPLKAGNQTASRGCEKGERLLSGWYAVVFGSKAAPSPALVSKVHVTLAATSGKVVASVRTDAGIPAAAAAKLQVGAVCAK
jgi:hypothetical protein